MRVTQMTLQPIDKILLEHSGEIVLITDERGTVLYANPAASEALLYGETELVGISACDIFRQEFAGADSWDIAKLSSVAETAMYRRNSSCVPVSVSSFAVNVSTSKAQEYCIMATDLTFSKDTDERLRKLKEEETQNLRARTEMTANITHELRTPVNGIKGQVLGLLDKPLDEETLRTLRLILSCCDNMSAIISDLLDFSKLESGKFTIEEREFDFRSMLDKIRGTHEAQCAQKELKLIFDIDERIPDTVIGDELRITQILNNLISNAVKFTPVGYIRVGASVTMRVGDEIELFFMVKDTGIGISEQEQDKLFQRFSQVDASTTRKYGGTGLGLVITKQLVELMHGQIHVESKKGAGSVFSFFIRLHTVDSVSGNARQGEVYRNWDTFATEYADDTGDAYLRFGDSLNLEEIDKRMHKLILSIELQAWDKADTLASSVKALVENGDEDVKKAALRMDMSIRKQNYDKSMEAFHKLSDVLRNRFAQEGADGD